MMLLKLKTQNFDIFASGGFVLHKGTSNRPALLDEISPEVQIVIKIRRDKLGAEE